MRPHLHLWISATTSASAGYIRPIRQGVDGRTPSFLIFLRSNVPVFLFSIGRGPLHRHRMSCRKRGIFMARPCYEYTQETFLFFAPGLDAIGEMGKHTKMLTEMGASHWKPKRKGNLKIRGRWSFWVGKRKRMQRTGNSWSTINLGTRAIHLSRLARSACSAKKLFSMLNRFDPPSFSVASPPCCFSTKFNFFENKTFFFVVGLFCWPPGLLFFISRWKCENKNTYVFLTCA